MIGRWLLCLALPLAGLSAWAQDINENPLTAVAQIKPQSLPAGATGELVIYLNLAPDHHAYHDQFKLKAITPAEMKVGQFSISPVVKFDDKFSKSVREGVEGEAELKAPIELPVDFKSGNYKAEFALTYQACTDEYCLLPKAINVSTQFTVTDSNLMGENTDKNTFNAQDTFAKAMEKGLVFAFILVFFGGVLASFTPCIFPMIPITLAVLGARSESSHIKGFFLSISYVLGIALTYAILGLIAAATGALFGSLLGNPIALGVIVVIFVTLGLSMYGLFEIRVPASIGQRLGASQHTGGYLGAFVAGLIAGVVASPCVGPILVGVLAFVAQTQSQWLGFWLLFTFAIGFGLLFIVVGTFTQLLNYLPRSGPWLNATKFILGTTMIGMALYYVEPVAPAWLFNALVATALVLISSFYGAFTPTSKLTPLLRLRKGIMLTALFLGIGFAVKAAFPGFFASVKNPVLSTHEEDTVNWQPYSDETLQSARAAGQPVIIDFYADWCAACKELEIYTFSESKVRNLGKSFLWLKFDATKTSEQFNDLKAQYGIIGLPYIAIYDVNGKWRQDLTLTGFEKADKFLERMKMALEK